MVRWVTTVLCVCLMLIEFKGMVMLGMEMTSRKTQPVEGLADSVCVGHGKPKLLRMYLTIRTTNKGLPAIIGHLMLGKQ